MANKEKNRLKDFIERYDNVVAMSRDAKIHDRDAVIMLCSFLNEYMPLPKNRHNLTQWQEIIKRVAEWDVGEGDYVFGVNVDDTTIYISCTNLYEFICKSFDLLGVESSGNNHFDFILADKDIARRRLDEILFYDKNKRKDVGVIAKKRDKDSYMSRLIATNMYKDKYFTDEVIDLLKVLNKSEYLTGVSFFKAHIKDNALSDLKKSYLNKIDIKSKDEGVSF